MESTILDKYVQNYLIYRQSEKRIHLRDKQFAFSVQSSGDFASDPKL